jgi:hypothetical protein
MINNTEKLTFKHFITRTSYIFLILILFFSLIPPKASLAQAPEVIEDEEGSASDTGPNTGSSGIATADPDGPHSKYDWPVEWSQMAHLLSSYQNYDYGTIEYAYFHQ